ncbi:MAG: hypothetical protein EOL95_11195 [Bacteroidia bacterium]|nr:hypothetical protein [Bacteroidia bacterium]
MKIQKIDTENKPIVFSTQEMFNQEYINDLTELLKTNLTIPTHTPKKFIDCFYLYWDGSTTYELYIYTSNSWKKTSLT